jgi:hypothetical protein
VDNTYTSAAMSSCGLFLNHGSNAASTNWTRYDNFKVTVDDPTNISTSISNTNLDFKVFATDNKIGVLGAKGQNLLISTLSGQLIKNEIITSDNQYFIINKGLYIVKISNQHLKVLIK